MVNDLFSYAKEYMTHSLGVNSLYLLQQGEGMTYEQAKDTIIKKIRQKENDFILAGLAVLNHPELGKDANVRYWISFLPYMAGGHIAWCQEVYVYRFLRS